MPTVHVRTPTARRSIAYSGNSLGQPRRINQSTITFTDPAPFTAAFSSRGPLTAGGGDLLKPDVIAPGQDILAAVAPPGNHGLDFNLLSGTSMSHPACRRRCGTTDATASNLVADDDQVGTNDVGLRRSSTPEFRIATRIFRQGAGHIKPNSAADPGLVYNSSFNDWLAFLCGTTNGVDPDTCAALVNRGYSLDPSDLNVASIAIGDLAGIQTVTRKVTNVGTSAATYTASTTGLAGITAVVSPSSLPLNPGQTGTFTVTFTRTTHRSMLTSAAN